MGSDVRCLLYVKSVMTSGTLCRSVASMVILIVFVLMVCSVLWMICFRVRRYVEWMCMSYVSVRSMAISPSETCGWTLCMRMSVRFGVLGGELDGL